MPATPDDRYCSRCGIPESGTDWERLVDVRVIISDGEEGFADIIQLLCDEHLAEMQVGLAALGFVDHRHGGINFLEDETCPGAANMDGCLSPTEYGTVTVGQNPTDDLG